MNKKNDIDVVINGREYTLSGYESGEYLQKIAAHINGKYDEFKLRDGYNRLDMDMKNIFLAINLSDEYFKAQKAADELKLENEEMEKEIFDMVEDTFMLKHVFPSNDPVNRPGSYERAKMLVHEIMKKYVNTYSDDFCRIRQDEARFELLVDEALITGSIDLLLKEDEAQNIDAAEVIDFKSMEMSDKLEEFDWREMSLQVQLYSRAAKEVIGENAETGYVHTLKDNNRVKVPVDELSVKNAIGAIEWAVKGILQEDFPMRACSANCTECDYRALCRQEREEFKRKELPPVINTPVGERVIAAFEEDEL